MRATKAIKMDRVIGIELREVKMSLSDDLNKKKFDVRLVDWNLRSTKISKEELSKHLDSLEDEGSKSEYLDISPDANAASAPTERNNLEH